MDDPIGERRAAEHMVVRLILGSIWEEIILSSPDPAKLLDEVSKRQLAALDHLAEQEGSRPMMVHAALHEMETFWQGVRGSVEGMIELRRTGGS